MKQLTKGNLLSKFGAQTYARGHGYFDEQRVLSLEIDVQDDQYFSFFSEVLGSGQRIYQQDINLMVHNNSLQIQGHCSCPMEFNCKHVVAACLEFCEHHEPAKTSAKTVSAEACQLWLEELTEVTQPPSELQAGSEFVIYRLGEAKVPGKIKVDLFCSRILKKGGLGKGRAIRLDSIYNQYDYGYGYSARYVQPVDKEIGRILHSNHISWHEILIENELGFLALTKMLSTGRCFWANQDQPLSASEPRQIIVEWNLDDRGNSKLTVRVTPESTLVLTQPLLYIDTQRQLAGSILPAAFTAKQLEKLLAAPVIPRELAPQFSQKIIQYFPAGELPPPQKVEIKKISRQKPVPRLVLFYTQNVNRQFHYMKLDFRYDEYFVCALPEEPVSSIAAGKHIVHIERDLENEFGFADQLFEAGFESAAYKNKDDLIFMSFGRTAAWQGIDRWQYFLDELKPQLQAQGWLIEFDESFRMLFHHASDWDVEIEENNSDWFDLSFKVTINGQPRSLLPLVAQVLENHDIEALPEKLHLNLGNNEYLSLPSSQLTPVLDVLYEIYDTQTLYDGEALRLSRYDSARLAELDQQSVVKLHWQGGGRLRELGNRLADFKGIEAVSPPKKFTAQLRDYQQLGLNWLQFLRHYNFGGILADDMGLGKTVQTLAHLTLEKQQGRLDKPCLIIAPTSLMSNWRREAQQFSPQLKVLVLQGPNRHLYFSQIAEHDVVLSTYPLLSRDKDELLAEAYYLLVLDEAQMVKNPKSKAAQILRKFDVQHRLCLTGTPMENHLGELWALFDFLMPRFLGDARQFRTRFRTPIEQHGDEDQRQRLARRIAPFMLRRSKSDVIDELPEKTQVIRSVTLDSKQAGLYESIRLAMEERVRKSIAQKGLSRSHITILDALLKLRQVCCDPRLLKLKQAEKVKQSAKLQLLMQILPEMLAEGRRVLLFSQFVQMLSLIEAELKRQQISYSKLTGQTRHRDAAIEQFQNGETSVFLISLKAGGVGLNLTAADTVIHYDPWWNPAAEDQASDRAHRIGQSKAVFVYKLMVENSVEEKILTMQERKKALAQGIYQPSSDDGQFMLSTDDIQELLTPL